MWKWLTRRIGPAVATGIAGAWLILAGSRARRRHETAWRARRERDGAGLTRFQREAESRVLAALAHHGVGVTERRVERGVWPSGAPTVAVTLYTTRPGLRITLEGTEGHVEAAGESRTAEEWDTPAPEDAFTTLLAAVEWSVRATAVPAV
jgi:hypothetical protein